MATYILKSNTSDITDGATFSRELSSGTESAGSITVDLSPGVSETNIGVTRPVIPNNDGWETGDITAEVNVTTASADFEISFQVHRINSAGSIQESSAVSTTYGMGSTGVISHTFSSLSWSAGNCSDRIRIDYTFSNIAEHGGSSSVDIETGTTDAEVITAITENGGSCDASYVQDLEQWESDHDTVIPVGGETTDGETNNIYLDKLVRHVDNQAKITPNVEIEEVGTAFDDTATHSGDFVIPKEANLMSIRRSQAMAYDSLRERIILFGGWDGTNQFNDVWEMTLPTKVNPVPQIRKLSPGGTAPGARRTHVLKYDSTNDRVIMFGGYDGSDLGDTWELDFSGSRDGSWSQLSFGTSPDARAQSASAIDNANAKMYIVCGWGASRFNDVWELDLTSGSESWSQIIANDASPSPERRSDPVVVHDSTNGRLIVFGGDDGTNKHNDTWEVVLDGTPAWNELTPSGTPPAIRTLGAGEYDSVNGRMIVFGGENDSTLGFEDYFELDLTSGSEAWTEHTETNGDRFAGMTKIKGAYSPDAEVMIVWGGQDSSDFESRYPILFDTSDPADVTQHGVNTNRYTWGRDAMAYATDDTANETIMMGGYAFVDDNDIDNGEHVSDIWIHDQANDDWYPVVRDSLNGMLPREGTVACFDSSRDRFLLFGGLTGNNTIDNTCFNDVHELKKGTDGRYRLNRLSPTGTRPAVRWLSHAVYDTVNDRMVIFGGHDSESDTYLNDSWELDFSGGEAGAWNELSPTGTAPTAVRQAGYFYDSDNNRMYIINGEDSGAYTQQTLYLDLTSGSEAWNSVSNGPTSRRSFFMRYDSSIGVAIGFGGYDGSHYSDTWTYDVGTDNWTELSPSTSPTARRSHNIGIDRTNKKLYIAFGRADTAATFNTRDDTWVLDYSDANSANWDWSLVETKTWVHASIGVTDLNTEVTDYYFDGGGGISDPDGVWTNEANAFDGDVDTDADGTNGSETSNYLQGKQTTAPTTGGGIKQVRARVYFATGYGNYVTLNEPTGGWTWDKVSKLETRIWATTDITSVISAAIYEENDAGGTRLGTAQNEKIEIESVAKVEIEVTSYKDGQTDYHWQGWSSDVDGNDSTKTSFGGNAESATDFTIGEASAGTAYTQDLSDAIVMSDSIAMQPQRSFLENLALADSVATAFTSSREFNEAIILADTITRQTQSALSDALTLVDQISRQVQRTITEAILLADQITNSLTASRAFTEAVAIVDTIKNQTTRAISEAISLVDTLASSKTYNRTFNELTTLSDTLSRSIQTARSETIALVDTVSNETTRVLSESISLVDQIATQTSRAFQEVVTITDNLARSASSLLTENITLQDVVDTTLSAFKTLSEQITASDSLNITKTLSRAYQETISLVDSIKQQTSRSFSDALTLADTVVNQIQRSLIEVITLNDTVDTGKDETRTFTENVSLADVIANQTSAAYQEVLNLADTIQATAQKVLSESANLVDSVQFQTTRAFSELVSIADSVVTTLTATRNLQEVVNLTDTIKNKTDRAFAEAINLVDTIVTSLTSSRAFTETVALAAAVSTTLTSSRAFTESIALIDSIKNRTDRAITETINLVDNLATTLTSSRAFQEAISLTDQIRFRAQLVFTEALDLVDSVVRSLTASRAFTETVSLVDSIKRTMNRTVSEAIALIDQVDPTITLSRTFSEVVSIVDTIKRQAQAARAEVINVTDTIATGLTALRTFVEDISLTDTLNRAAQTTLTDSLAIVDSIRRQAQVIRTETLAIVDTIRRQVTRSFSELVSATATFTSQVQRTLKESANLTDIFESTFSLSKAFTEVVGIIDGIALHTDKILAETINLTDSIRRQTDRVLSDAVTAADTIITTTGRSFSEVVAAADNITTATSRSFAEAITAVDTFITSTSRSFAEVLSVTDTIITSMSRAFTEVVTVTDTIRRSIQKSLTESTVVIDTIQITKSLTRSFIESLSLADVINKATQTVRAESVALTDTISRVADKVLAETLSVVDTVRRSVNRTIIESLSLVDSLTNDTAGQKTLTDTLTVDDTITRTATKVISNSLALVDDVFRRVTRSFTESLSLSDLIDKAVQTIRTESVSLVDTISRASDKVFTETLSLIDTIRRSVTRSFTEITGLTDTVSIQNTFSRAFSDTLSVIDTVSSQIAAKVLRETVNATDSIRKMAQVVRSETLQLLDDFIDQSSESAVFTESVQLADKFGRAFEKLLSEAVTVTDVIANAFNTAGDVFKTILKSVSDGAATILGTKNPDSYTIADDEDDDTTHLTSG